MASNALEEGEQNANQPGSEGIGADHNLHQDQEKGTRATSLDWNNLDTWNGRPDSNGIKECSDDEYVWPEFKPTVPMEGQERNRAYLKRVREQEESRRLAFADISETEFSSDGDEEFLDSLRSPRQYTCRTWTPSYQARRDAKKRLLSPPSTPPCRKKRKTLTASKAKQAYTPRRPVTRSSGQAMLSLGDRRGVVVFKPEVTAPITMSYEKYLRCYVSEGYLYGRCSG